ncbi:MAG: S-layer homology domain-containing protein [Oscillospiraceae bacterium]|nr:S-layer homology domain-containing protein [Oscillospiraceae bacterium]
MRKILTLLLVFAVLLSLGAASAFAAPISSFPDVPSTHWAHGNIISMANEGYILGFPDGTFGPDLSVTHIQSLILLARVLGVDEAGNSAVVQAASQRHASVLAPFQTDFAREVAFLIYNDVIHLDELELYISNQPLPRYRAAILLTKLMGGEREVLDSPVMQSSFSDAAQMPMAARMFAEYVRTHGIMQGTGTTAAGVPIFSPQTMVTRAQMATMLANLLDIMDRQHITGSISAIDTVLGTIAVITPGGATRFTEIESNSVLYVDGQAGTLNQNLVGNAVRITYIHGVARIIDISTTDDVPGNNNNNNNQPSNDNDELEFILSNVVTQDGTIQVVVQDVDDSSVAGRHQYALAPGATFTLNGTNAIRQDIRNGYLVYLTLNNNNAITHMRAYSRNAIVQGTLQTITGTGQNVELTVRVTNNNQNRTFRTSPTRNVVVVRNGVNSDLRSVLVGDNLTLTLEHNRIVRVEARSTDGQGEGIIEEINIARNPTIVIRVGENLRTYHIASEVTITLDHTTTNATIYDLRIGSRIRYRLESQTIVWIESTAAAAIDRVDGIVRSIDTSFRFISLDVVNPVTGQTTTQEVLVEQNANITQVGVTGARNINHIQVGQEISAFGSNVTGNFRANTILIITGD